MPCPCELDSTNVSGSSHSTEPLASGKTKPSLTKVFASISNSRKVTESLPPRERLKIVRL